MAIQVPSDVEEVPLSVLDVVSVPVGRSDWEESTSRYRLKTQV